MYLCVYVCVSVGVSIHACVLDVCICSYVCK